MRYLAVTIALVTQISLFGSALASNDSATSTEWTDGQASIVISTTVFDRASADQRCQAYVNSLRDSLDSTQLSGPDIEKISSCRLSRTGAWVHPDGPDDERLPGPILTD